MTSPRRIHFLSAAGALILAASVAAGQTAEHDPTLPPNPSTVLLQVTGRGVQIYSCKTTEAGPAWAFVAPEAKLYDAAGVETGSHGAGPHRSLNDGSSVRGKVIAQQPSPVSGAVPWLLLAAVEPKGPGLLAGATYIRRSDTAGGKAHSDGCDAAHIGAEDRVPYTATYTFYGAPPN